MRVCAISDTHGKHSEVFIEPCDLLIHAGDISGRGAPYEYDNFFNWFLKQPAKHKILIAGNHDFDLHTYSKPPEVNYLHHSYTMVEGYKIFGSPYTPKFFNWAYMYDVATAGDAIWRDIPRDTELLITHGPPFKIGDYASEHAGCPELRLKVQEIKPLVHIFGHIHEGAGMYVREETLYLNASVLNSQYRVVHKPTYFDIPKK